jgi:hypothetical protein
MLQYHRNGWQHRAVWGDYDVIPWGNPNTPERVHMGPLPKTGEWVKLEVAADKVGLNAGDNLTGFATTQFAGTVYWDKIGIVGVSDPANDPQRSLLAWWKNAKGKDTPGLPGDLNAIAKAGPDPAPDAASVTRLKEYYLARICTDTKPNVAELTAQIDKARADRDGFYNAIPSTFIYKDNPTPRESFVMLRGQYNQPGEKVQPDVLSVLPPIQKPASGQLNRLDLAKWLVSPRHPLTSRVAVNRYWQQVFGVGLVKSSGDFGTQGETPSHPELLDWLAIHFEDSGWDVKGLMRLMLTSAAFKQSSRIQPEVLEKDPENRLLAHAPRLRLDAEQIRDSILQVSGSLDDRMGGPSDTGDSNRRSVYQRVMRNSPNTLLATFDAPDASVSIARRNTTTTSLQSLFLTNSPWMIRKAESQAKKIIAQNESTQARTQAMFQQSLLRDPTQEEYRWIETLIESSNYSDPLGAWTDACQSLWNSSEFLYTE